MSYVHAIVWLDHLHARVIGFSTGDGETVEIHSESSQRQLHRKSGKPGSGHAANDVTFFDDVAATLADGREILIAGPGTAKTAFSHHLEERHPELARRVVGVETMDHPSDGELLSFARRYFKRIDQLGTY